MPVSMSEHKDWLLARYRDLRPETIIDIGPGVGTYADLFRRHHAGEWTGIEVWEPYVDEYGLREKYNSVIVSDVQDVDLSTVHKRPSLVIAGDVIEHLEKAAALRLIDRLKVWAENLFISIPLGEHPQGAVNGNEYETHRSTWSHEEMITALGEGLVGAVSGEVLGAYHWQAQRSRRRLHVAFIADLVYPHSPAGAERMMHNLAVATAAAGHNVEVLGFRSHVDGLTHFDDIPIRGGRTARIRWRGIQPDIVVAQLGGAVRLQAAKQRGLATVLVLHGDSYRNQRGISDRPDLVVHNTEWLREKLPYRNSILVHPPVYREHHATTAGEHVTLVNLIPGKGAHVFYELARRLPNVKFLGVRGGYGEQVVEDLPNVTIIDSTTGMRGDVWSKTSILLMPSVAETYGLAGVEALCSGIPVLAHPTDGLREALGGGGIFIDRDDIDTYERTVKRLLGSDTAMTKARKAALARAASLDTDREVATFVSAIEALAASKGKGAAA